MTADAGARGVMSPRKDPRRLSAGPRRSFMAAAAEGRRPIAVSILLAVARLLARVAGVHTYDLLAEAILAVDSPEARKWGDR